MTIKRYVATKDNTIVNAFKENLISRSTLSNMGASDILEFFSIYAQASSSSLEQARVIIEFPVGSILADRNSGALKGLGSDQFILRLSNVPHGQTTPQQYTVSVSPLLVSWEEGRGLDMESYRDLDASNWLSSSDGTSWTNQGSDFASLGHIVTSSSPMEFTKFISRQDEDIDVDITDLVEDWIKHSSGKSTTAGAYIDFNAAPSSDELILLYSYKGVPRTFQFKNDVSGPAGGGLFFVDNNAGSVQNTVSDFVTQINAAFGGDLEATISPSDNTIVNLSQGAAGYYGNTIVSASKSSEFTYMPTALTGGTGAINYGVVVKLSGSSEDGTNQESFYTKKLFSRTSQFFFRRPAIEARFDNSIKDDRTVSFKSSSLASESDNINRIYLYNKQRSGLADIAGTGSALLVQLYSSASATTPETLPVGAGVQSHSRTFITASRHSLGIYEAQFTYDGELSTLVDVWQYSGSNGYIQLHTGSQINITSDNLYSHYDIDSYSLNITNLKPSYGGEEKAVFRVYTRNKTKSPNVYTVASSRAPVSVLRQGFFQVSRVSDNHVIIPYTTGSSTQYSSLSYDMSGSFFELDMSLLEPNYNYEISFLRQDGLSYVEQTERFRFRVDP